MSDSHHRWYLRRVGAFQHIRTILHLDDVEVTINRSHTATHTFQTRYISRKHATLKNVNGEWLIKDNGGVNGTFLNTDKIIANKEYPLVENDIIGFGMPLSQQNEEDSVVYRLCKDTVNKLLVSNSRTSATESQGSEKTCVKVVPNNHLMINNPVGKLQLKKELKQDADETIVQPDCEFPSKEPDLLNQVSGLPVLVIKKELDCPSENPPEYQVPPPEIANCDFTMHISDGVKVAPGNMACQKEEIECIHIDDSDDETSPPAKQVVEPQPRDSNYALPRETPSAAACGSASLDANVVELSDDDANGDRETGSNSFKGNDMPKYNKANTKPETAIVNMHSDNNPIERKQVPESVCDDVLMKLANSGMCHTASTSENRTDGVQLTRECASPELFSESTNSKTKTTRRTDEDAAAIVQPTTGYMHVALDETAKSPSVQSSNSERELFDDSGYSQEDEIIIISDDEIYLSQKNVKVASNEAACIVKEEIIEENDAPCDLGENDDWDKMFHERLMEDIASDCAAEVSKSSVETRQTRVEIKTPEVTDPGSIAMDTNETLTLSKSPVSMQADNSKAGPSGVNTTVNAEMIEGATGTNDFFPILSQSFYDGERSSESEEDENQADHSSAEDSNVQQKMAACGSRISGSLKTTLTSQKKPSSINAFYSLNTKDNFDRLKHKPGQMPSHGVKLMRPLPNVRGRNAISNTAPLQRSCVKPTTFQRKAKSKGKGSTAMKEVLKKNFVKNRIPIPGGGTDIPTGHKAPTKEKPGFHVRAGKDKLTKLPNNTIKSSSSRLERPVKQNVESDTPTPSTNNFAEERSISNASSVLPLEGRNIPKESSVLPQEGAAQERRSSKFRFRDHKSRNEQLALDFMASTSKAPKRKSSPLRTAKPPPKRRAAEKPAAETRKETEDKDLPKPPKQTILLSAPPPISSRHHPSVKPSQHIQPLKASGKANLSELDIKNKKPNKRVSFSKNPPEIRYYQPDTRTVEEQIFQDENEFGEAPQRPEVMAALERILGSILSWKPAWLREQERVKDPPPVVDFNNLKDAMTVYSSHAEYVTIYEPLLLLETWESISQEWRHSRDSCPVIQIVLSRILQDFGSSKSPSLFFHCHAVIADVDEHKSRLPQEGWLTILDVPVNSENPGAKVDGVGRSYVRLFAYVKSCQKSTIKYLQKDESISPLLKQLISKHKDKKVVLKLVLQSRCTVLSVNEDRPLNLEMVAYLKPQLRIFQALHFLPFSLLGSHILKPKEELCSLSNVRPSMTLLNLGTISYNETQRDIILKTTVAVTSSSASPKICLVQGPPGTGKSSLVIGMILQLLFGNPTKSKAKPRILLCAPSNGAIDEIFHRLLKLRKTLTNSRKLRMIRLGLLDSIQLRVKPYSLDNIVRSNIENQKTVLEKEVNDLITALNVQRQKIDTMKLRNGKLSEANKLKMDFDRIESKLGVVKKKLDEWHQHSPEESQRVYCSWREECLKNADVIATTLGSCTQHGMEIFLRNNNHPFICIVDEATQSIELETLLPLQFSVSKLILIGDPKQLPATVLSMRAKEKNLCQSLFERFYNNFGHSRRNPIVMLEIQYRMHPELCFYPSKAFYRNKLRTDSEVEKKCAAVPVRPYLFFDIQDSQEESTGIGDISNPKEATFVVKLCEALLLNLTNFQSVSLGVITFYQHQRHLIKEKLAASSTLQQLDKVAHIEVNTVDGFQGREKDIIVVSSVRAHSSNGRIGFINQQRRLNVAITRAKFSLFICGYCKSLKVSEHWRGLIEDADFRRKVEKVASPIPVNALQTLVARSYR